MDSLDRLAGTAADLLGRVDDALTRYGAPDDHAIWPLMRQVRALPGDAVAAIAAQEPGPFAEAAIALRRALDAYRGLDVVLNCDTGWAGPSAESFAVQWTALRTHVGSATGEGLVGALNATVSYVDAIEQWIRAGRQALARALATVLTCAEAVQVHVGGENAARAAADIGRYVLACVADILDRGERLVDEWRDRLAERPYPLPAALVTGGEPTTIVPG